MATPQATTPAKPVLPVWHDGAADHLALAPSAAAPSAGPPAAVARAPGAPQYPSTSPRVDGNVQPAVFHADAIPSAASDARRLAPPGDGSRAALPDSSSTSGRLPRWSLPTGSVYTVATALALVIGLFLLLAWVLRRGGNRKANKTLSDDVVSVLGRKPLAADHVAELIRLGNKLVLVSVSSGGAETLAEVTDPVEVDRLLGLCEQSDRFSTTAEFEQVFRQLAQEPAPRGFLGDETSAQPQTVATPFPSFRGAA